MAIQVWEWRRSVQLGQPIYLNPLIYFWIITFKINSNVKMSNPITISKLNKKKMILRLLSLPTDS